MCVMYVQHNHAAKLCIESSSDLLVGSRVHNRMMTEIKMRQWCMVHGLATTTVRSGGEVMQHASLSHSTSVSS